MSDQQDRLRDDIARVRTYGKAHTRYIGGREHQLGVSMLRVCDEVERLQPFEPSGRISLTGTVKLERLEHIAEAARAVPEPLDGECVWCEYRRPDHAPDCPWLVLQRAFAGGESGE